MTFMKFATATAITALPVPVALRCMMADSTAGYGRFTGFNEAGYHDAWDTDDDGLLSDREFGTGMYADWDTDNDLQISNDEYTVGAERWYGADHDSDFDTLDEDSLAI